MFGGKDYKGKKYNIIIIPERGSNTKKLNLTSVMIKTAATVFSLIGITAVVLIYVFSNRYNKLAGDAAVLKNREAYIKSLEEENKNMDKEIQNYKVYQKAVSDKVKKLEELEKEIKDKLDKSSFMKNMDTLKNMSSQNSPFELVPMSGLEEDQTSIETIDQQIEALMAIDKKLDELLEKEQYIPSVPPCEGRITSYFGTRDNPFGGGNEETHLAIDVANDYGTKIHSTAKGTVIFAEARSGYGNCVCIDHGNGITSLYAHASELLVEAGQIVEKGEVIALMGSTGRSTGPHVHFELRKNGEPYDPIKIFE